MITIVGATGTVGKPLLQALIQAEVPLRVLTRDKAKARELWPSEAVDVVEVNFDDVRSLRQGLLGSDQAFFAVGTSDRQLRDEFALIDAAVAAKVGHVVALSVGGADKHSAHPVLHWHGLIDERLRSTGLAATWLKPGTFTDTLGRVSSNFVRAGAWGGFAGDGRVAAIDTRDVAAVAAKVLLQGKAQHSGKSYELTGPVAVSMLEFAAEISARIAKPVSYTQRTREEQRAVLEAAGVSALFVEVLLALDDATRHSAFAIPTQTVFELTGVQPRSVSNWIAEHAQLFV
jgi:NAD(P)H dehydrogenase (quinone)